MKTKLGGLSGVEIGDLGVEADGGFAGLGVGPWRFQQTGFGGKSARQLEQGWGGYDFELQTQDQFGFSSCIT